MVQKYRKFVENAFKTGQARSRKPDFYDEMNNLLGSSPVINPKFTVSMGEMPATSSTSFEEIIIEPDVTFEEQLELEIEPTIARPVTRRIRPPTRMESVQTAINELVSESRKFNENKITIHNERLAFEKEKFLYFKHKMEEDANIRKQMQKDITRNNILLNGIENKVNEIEKKVNEIEK